MKTIWLALLNRIMAYLCGRLWELAKEWVALYERKDLTSAEKRERVADMLREEARIVGVDLAESLINLAIEAALQIVRRKAA